MPHDDNDIRDRHPLSCPSWIAKDPIGVCNCGADDDFTAGVDAKLAVFDSYETAS